MSPQIKILSPTSPHDIAAVCTAHNLTPPEFQSLLEHARAAKERAYCPYSKFRVGAALLVGPKPDPASAAGKYEGGGDEMKIVVGANVENASYPVTTCAERVAFGTAVMGGYHVKGGFRAVAVSTDGVGPASPCGMCRQL